MIAGAFSIFTLLAVASAASVPTAGIASRDDGPAISDLLASCPGGPGTSAVEKADKCAFTDTTTNPDIRVWKPLGEAQLNCGGATDPITVTLGGSTDVTQTVEASVSAGLDLDGLSIGGGLTTSSSTSTSTSKTVSFDIQPGKQAVFAAGVAMHSLTGTIQVNYADRVDGHFIWFVSGVTQQVPIDPENIQFDVYESDCGTNPTDLSSLSTAV